jgi:thiamine biosynthesis lipoprotein
MADYEAMLSRTVEGSDVWNINHSNGEPVEVSGETASLIETALTYCDLSGGRFDIAVAPIVDLWNFHEDGDHTLPDDDVLAEALTHIDYHNVTVDGTTVTLQDPDAGIDLGGIAKGYIADRLKDYIVSQGVTSGLINLGGNTLTIGQKPGGKDWKLGIRKPFGETASDLIAILSVNDDSLVTSGNYERYFEKDGIIYHHILDPDTGYPAQTGLQSVSILSDSSADGDALSTTCFLLGAEDGLALIESLDGIEALFVTDEQEIIRSSGFPADES